MQRLTRYSGNPALVVPFSKSFDWPRSVFEENKERRSSPRFQVSLPLVLKFYDPVSKRVREEGTVSRDASARGTYLYSETELTKGAALEFTLFVEPGALQVRYKAKVVRWSGVVMADMELLLRQSSTVSCLKRELGVEQIRTVLIHL